jgi:hypothetical protein
MNTIAEIKSSETSQNIFVTNKPSWSSIESNALYLFNWTQTSLLDYTNLHGVVKDEDIQSVEYTQIDKLINFNYTLRKPIKVRIIKNLSGEVIGDIEELELYSFGNNEFEVLREINEELTDLFEDLRDVGDDNLGKFPKKWKAILKKYINENKRLYRK